MSNLYCDLAINSVALWYGIPCLNSVPIGVNSYNGFKGLLFWVDTQGNDDPDYANIGPNGRFQLIYNDQNGNLNQVPTNAIPSQQFDAQLGNQNCTIALYEK